MFIQYFYKLMNNLRKQVEQVVKEFFFCSSEQI